MNNDSPDEHLLAQRPRRRVHAHAWLLLAALGVLVPGGFWWWKQGTPYQAAFWSPNKEYYVQKYANITPWSMTMPGGSSDAVDGYIRLYRKDGTLIAERFAVFIRDVEPTWEDRTVYLMGIPPSNQAAWTTPTSTE